VRGISLLAEGLLALQEGLCCMGLVSYLVTELVTGLVTELVTNLFI
jgi:hypothetical protein